MRFGGLIALLLSVVVAVGATLWIRVTNETAPTAPVIESTIVVAAEDIRSGQKLDRNLVKTIKWYSDTLPEGAFRSVDDLPWTENGPFAMVPVKKGTMIAVTSISGPNQRPTLSGLLGPGMVATTIQVNTISGVAGFVLPEERVDVILNRLINGRRTAEVILENLRVLAVDSIVDPQSGKPVPARSVTFEINRDQAQKLSVAANLGEITLALRAANSDSYSPTSRVSDADIGPARTDQNAPVAQTQPDGTQMTTGDGSQIDSTTVDALKKEIENLKQSGTSAETNTGDATDPIPSDLKNLTVIRGLNRDIQAVPAR